MAFTVTNFTVKLSNRSKKVRRVHNVWARKPLKLVTPLITLLLNCPLYEHFLISHFVTNDCLVSCFKGAPLGLRQFLGTESPLKMMKNAFYFTSKALFVLKIFEFLSELFGHVSNGFIKKIRLISNFMT